MSNFSRLLARCFVVVASAVLIGASPVPEDPVKTARFATFFSTVLAGHAPSSGLSIPMQQGLTSDAISQVDAYYAASGKFEKLQYVGEDSVSGYERYHYTAVFDKGNQGVVFVLDADGNIAGFFMDR